MEGTVPDDTTPGRGSQPHSTKSSPIISLAAPADRIVFGIGKPPPLVEYEATDVEGGTRSRRFRIDLYALLLLAAILLLILRSL
jgi:hypothetical protein